MSQVQSIRSKRLRPRPKTDKGVRTRRELRQNETIFTPESRYLITLDREHYNAIRVWDTLSGHEVRKLTLECCASGIALSPDGRWLAMSVGQHEITVLRRKD